MRADRDRIGEQRQIGCEPFRKGPGQRLQPLTPCAIFMPRGLGVQGQQPAPAIGPFEPARFGSVEIGEFGRQLVGREGFIRQRGDLVRFGHLREQPPQGQQRPPAMDAAVPVVTAEKHRMRLARRADIRVRGEDVIVLEGIGPRHMAERDPGVAARQIFR